jgi:hypothetical protein
MIIERKRNEIREERKRMGKLINKGLESEK